MVVEIYLNCLAAIAQWLRILQSKNVLFFSGNVFFESNFDAVESECPMTLTELDVCK